MSVLNYVLNLRVIQLERKNCVKFRRFIYYSRRLFRLVSMDTDRYVSFLKVHPPTHPLLCSLPMHTYLNAVLLYSIYLATSSDHLRDIVKPELLQDWDRRLHGYHGIPSDQLRPGHDVSFLPRECCDVDRAADQKTPLFFKQEYFGRGIIALGEFPMKKRVFVYAYRERDLSIYLSIHLSGSKTIVARGSTEEDVKVGYYSYWKYND